jgi:hypothetical protein
LASLLAGQTGEEPDCSPLPRSPRARDPAWLTVEQIAHDMRQTLDRGQAEALAVAARRLRGLDRLREAVFDRVATVARLERDLARLRGR